MQQAESDGLKVAPASPLHSSQARHQALLAEEHLEHCIGLLAVKGYKDNAF
jgi:hypothetical protein